MFRVSHIMAQGQPGIPESPSQKVSSVFYKQCSTQLNSYLVTFGHGGSFGGTQPCGGPGPSVATGLLLPCRFDLGS